MIIFAVAMLIAQSVPNEVAKPEPRYTLVNWSDHATTMLFVDNTTIKRDDFGVRAWTTYIYNGNDIQGKVKIYKDYSEYHCGKGEVTLLYYQTENSAGTVIDAEKIETSKRDYIVPDSFGQSVYDYVCLDTEARRTTPKESRSWRYLPADKDIREVSDLAYVREAGSSGKRAKSKKH